MRAIFYFQIGLCQILPHDAHAQKLNAADEQDDADGGSPASHAAAHGSAHDGPDDPDEADQAHHDAGSGDDADAELTATAAASEKDAGSKSKSAVSTADESPIGTMSALAALSLLAGGYIVVRKRKKEEL